MKYSKIYKLAATNTSTTAAAASIVVQKDCLITALEWVITAIGDAAGEGTHAELSLVQTAQHSTNDTSGVIDAAACVANAIGGASTNKTVSGIAFPLRAGERLNLNILSVGTPTACVQVCFVHVLE